MESPVVLEVYASLVIDCLSKLLDILRLRVGGHIDSIRPHSHGALASKDTYAGNRCVGRFVLPLAGCPNQRCGVIRLHNLRAFSKSRIEAAAFTMHHDLTSSELGLFVCVKCLNPPRRALHSNTASCGIFVR